jgi:hypothetical protein
MKNKIMKKLLYIIIGLIIGLAFGVLFGHNEKGFIKNKKEAFENQTKFYIVTGEGFSKFYNENSIETQGIGEKDKFYLLDTDPGVEKMNLKSGDIIKVKFGTYEDEIKKVEKVKVKEAQ